ncbi:MAG: glycosyltransferase family 2 protein [Elusimicrobiota bacterium]|jgi:dolichol-phosphate mannosyltransferase
MSPTIAPVLSVVGPVFDEAAGLETFHASLIQVLRGLGLSFEIIYVDDGSRDRSPELLRELRGRDPEVRTLTLSRNFGHQLAITAGLDHARGAACIVMDTDGQDPPGIIPELLAAWRQGYEVVYAVRSSRQGEGWFKKLSAGLFYRLLRRMTRVDIPLDAGDFRLLDRKALDVLRDLRETHRFMRGLTCWVGFRQTKVMYARKPRLAGDTHYPLWEMARFALDGITSFSHEPLRWVTACGAASFLLSLALGCWALYVRFYNPQAVRGWTSLIVVVLLLGGLQLIGLGVVGEYLARIFDEVKRRPLYVVRAAEGFDPDG